MRKIGITSSFPRACFAAGALILAGRAALAGPTANVAIDVGAVNYQSAPSERIAVAGGNVGGFRTLGFTSVKLKVKTGVELDPIADGRGCLPILSVDISIGYPNIDVLIDDRYTPGSCEYEAIKAHEDGHVRIYREELEYYGKLIEDELLISSLNVESVCMKEGEGKASFKNKVNGIVRDDERLNLLLSRLSDSVKEKSAAYDSAYEYERLKAECHNW